MSATRTVGCVVTVIVFVTEVSGWGFPEFYSEEHHHHHHHHHHVVHHQHTGWERQGYVYEVPKVRLKYPFEKEREKEKVVERVVERERGMCN